MKHFFSLLLLGFGLLRPLLAQAQPGGSDSLSQKLTSIFAHLDNRQVPTGYLYEASVRYPEPRFYSGTLTDSNRTDLDVLRYLRASMN